MVGMINVPRRASIVVRKNCWRRGHWISRVSLANAGVRVTAGDIPSVRLIVLLVNPEIRCLCMASSKAIRAAYFPTVSRYLCRRGTGQQQCAARCRRTQTCRCLVIHLYLHSLAGQRPPGAKGHGQNERTSFAAAAGFGAREARQRKAISPQTFVASKLCCDTASVAHEVIPPRPLPPRTRPQATGVQQTAPSRNKA